jgi:hypothetical protein
MVYASLIFILFSFCCLSFPFVVVFVVASCIVYVLAVVMSFIFVFLYCVLL